MNTQAAAVLNFQLPSQYEGKGIKINFANWVGYSETRELTMEFTHCLKGFKNALMQMECAEFYSIAYIVANLSCTSFKFEGIGMLNSLMMLGAITKKEFDRLSSLFCEHSNQP